MWRLVNPTYVGMNRSYILMDGTPYRKPHIRGDEPVEAVLANMPN